jgi:predicted nucleic acid-binding protein
MSDRLFLDTNVLVYAYDRYAPLKQKKAQSLIAEGIRKENLFLSVQVLGEFFNVVTRHIPKPMTIEEAEEIITTVSVLPVQEIDLAMVKRAIATLRTYKISYWDALIVSAAERAGCTVILSEDLSDGQTYNEMQVHNPFGDQ